MPIFRPHGTPFGPLERGDVSHTLFVASDELLLAQNFHLSSGQGIDALYHPNGGKTPAAAALAIIHMLIFDGPNYASLSPVY